MAPRKVTDISGPTTSPAAAAAAAASKKSKPLMNSREILYQSVTVQSMKRVINAADPNNVGKIRKHRTTWDVMRAYVDVYMGAIIRKAVVEMTFDGRATLKDDDVLKAIQQVQEQSRPLL
jgi:histone H3/H4